MKFSELQAGVLCGLVPTVFRSSFPAFLDGPYRGSGLSRVGKSWCFLENEEASLFISAGLGAAPGLPAGAGPGRKHQSSHCFLCAVLGLSLPNYPRGCFSQLLGVAC